MKRSLNIILLLIVCVASASAKGITMKAPDNVIQGRTFQVSFLLDSPDFPRMQAPEIDGCRLVGGPFVSQSSSIEIVNGRQTSSSEYSIAFEYVAVTPGKYVIPAVAVDINGVMQKTSGQVLSILPEESNKSASNIFIRVILNKTEVYEQEAIEMTVKLYSKSGIVKILDKQPDAYDGFIVEDIPGSGNWDQVEHYNGSNYYTSVLRRAILFPQKTGELTVGSGDYEAITVEEIPQYIGSMHIGNRTEQRRITLAPGSTKIKVLPLPSPTPSSFNGAVGNYTIDTQLSNTNLRTGDAATLKVIVSGTGNLKGMSAPKVNFPEDFEVYPVRSEPSIKVSGNNLSGKIIYEYTFVPQEVGSFELPVLEFSYFDPAKKEYQTITKPAVALNVAQGTHPVNKSKNKINQDVKDIKHIIEGDKNQSHSHSLLAHSIWYWLVYPILVTLLITLVIVSDKHRKAKADVIGRKISQANKVAQKRLKKASLYLQENKYDLLTQEILKALWGYLSDKLTIPVSELSRSNITEILQKVGVNQATVDNTINTIDNCEMSRYAGSAPNQQMAQTLYNQATQIINSIESIKIKK